MVDCPECDNGFVYQDTGEALMPARCDYCHGKGQLTEEQYREWCEEEADIETARRNYMRQFTED